MCAVFEMCLLQTCKIAYTGSFDYNIPLKYRGCFYGLYGEKVLKDLSVS